MKILFHIPLYLPYHPCGAEWMVNDYAIEMQKRGHDVTVMCDRNPAMGGRGEYKEFNNIPIICETDSMRMIKQYEKSDVILSHLGRIGFAFNVCSEIKKPLIYIDHNGYRVGILQAHNEIGMIYNSEFTKAQNWYPQNPGVICYPILIKENKNGKSEKEPKKITTTNLADIKGGKLFADIATAMPAYRFLASRGYYGSPYLVQPENVKILDALTDMDMIYNRSKIILIPSKYESYCRVAIEAISRNIPVITSDLPGLRESLGESGIFVKRENLNEWMEAIEKLMTDKIFYMQQQQKCRLRTLEFIEQSKASADRFEDFLYQMTGRQKEFIPVREDKQLHVKYQNK